MPADSLAEYRLIRPTVADVLVAVYRAHGPNAASVWTQLLVAAGLAGHETDDRALNRLLDAMTTQDPVSAISARSLRIRLKTFDNLAVAQGRLSADHRTAGSAA